MTNKITRRVAIQRGIQISVGGASLLTLSACGAAKDQQFACVDPDEMSEGEKSMRVSLSYMDTSPVVGESCQGCAFFEAGDAGCGACELLGGQVSSGGRCNSWSATS